MKEYNIKHLFVGVTKLLFILISFTTPPVISGLTADSPKVPLTKPQAIDMQSNILFYIPSVLSFTKQFL